MCLLRFVFVCLWFCHDSLHENCYCVSRHCLQLLQNNTNKGNVAPIPGSYFRLKHWSPLGNRHCAHSLTEISWRKQAWAQGIREEKSKRGWGVSLLYPSPPLFSSGPNYLVSDVSVISVSLPGYSRPSVGRGSWWPRCWSAVLKLYFSSAGTVILIKEDTRGTGLQSSSSVLHFSFHFWVTQSAISYSKNKFPQAWLVHMRQCLLLKGV